MNMRWRNQEREVSGMTLQFLERKGRALSLPRKTGEGRFSRKDWPPVQEPAEFEVPADILWRCSSDSGMRFAALGVAGTEHGFAIYQQRIRRWAEGEDMCPPSPPWKCMAPEGISLEGTPGMSGSKEQELKRKKRSTSRGSREKTGESS